jgi:hypothetical protein
MEGRVRGETNGTIREFTRNTEENFRVFEPVASKIKLGSAIIWANYSSCKGSEVNDAEVEKFPVQLKNILS